MHYITIKLANLCAKVANEISEKDMEKSFKIIDKINKDSRRRAAKIGVPISESGHYEPSLHIDKKRSIGSPVPVMEIYGPMTDNINKRSLPDELGDAILLSSAVTNAEAIKKGNIHPVGRHHDISGHINEIGNAIKFPKSVIKRYLYAHYHLDDSPSNEADIERMGTLADISDSSDIYDYLEEHKGSNKEFMDRLRKSRTAPSGGYQSDVREEYVKSMVRRARGKRGKDNDAYNMYHNLLHKDLRLDPEEEKHTVSKIHSDALREIPSGARTGALVAGIPALAYTMAKHRLKPSRGAMVGTGLAALIGSAIGGKAGYSSHISNEANKHYIYRMYGKAKDKGD